MLGEEPRHRKAEVFSQIISGLRMVAAWSNAYVRSVKSTCRAIATVATRQLLRVMRKAWEVCTEFANYVWTFLRRQMRAVLRLYLRAEAWIAQLTAELALFVWALRSVAALLALEAGLVYIGTRWWPAWIPAIILGLVLVFAAMATARGASSASTGAEAEYADNANAVVAKWTRRSLRALLAAVGIFAFCARLLPGLLPSLRPFSVERPTVLAGTSSREPDGGKPATSTGAAIGARVASAAEALVNAAQSGDEATVTRLLASGTSPNSTSLQNGDAFSGDVSALTFAVVRGRTSIVRLLLLAGANPNTAGTYDRCVFADAMATGNDSIVTLLRSAGAILPTNPASLVAASAGGYLSDVQYLVDHGADVNAGAGYKGSSRALSAAAYAGHADIVALLLAKGALTDARDEDNQTAFDYAARRGDSSITAILIAAGAQSRPRDESSATRGLKADVLPMRRHDASVCTEQRPNSAIVTIDKGGQDTFVGDAYQKDGAPREQALSFGGWGDHYYDYLQFAFPASGTPPWRSATLCIYALVVALNDPQLEVGIVTEKWTDGSVSIAQRPQFSTVGAFGAVTAGWNAVDVSGIVGTWLSSSATNYGIVLLPRANNQTNGRFASGEAGDATKRPRLVLRGQ